MKHRDGSLALTLSRIIFASDPGSTAHQALIPMTSLDRSFVLRFGGFGFIWRHRGDTQLIAEADPGNQQFLVQDLSL